MTASLTMVECTLEQLTTMFNSRDEDLRKIFVFVAGSCCPCCGFKPSGQTLSPVSHALSPSGANCYHALHGSVVLKVKNGRSYHSAAEVYAVLGEHPHIAERVVDGRFPPASLATKKISHKKRPSQASAIDLTMIPVHARNSVNLAQSIQSTYRPPSQASRHRHTQSLQILPDLLQNRTETPMSPTKSSKSQNLPPRRQEPVLIRQTLGPVVQQPQREAEVEALRAENLALKMALERASSQLKASSGSSSGTGSIRLGHSRSASMQDTRSTVVPINRTLKPLRLGSMFADKALPPAMEALEL